MQNVLILLDHISIWKPYYPTESIITASEYLEQKSETTPNLVINLCGDITYNSEGYYCSLLAEARQHRVIPSVKTILELNQRAIYRPALPELDEALRKRVARMADPPEIGFPLYIYFGQADDRRFQKLAQRIYDMFRCPVLKVVVRRRESFHIQSIQPVTVDELTPAQVPLFLAGLAAFTRAAWRAPRARSLPRFSLAILHDAKEALPPSNERTLQRFVRAGESLGLDVELIQKRDQARLTHFDALFIRETTALHHHTFRFAQRAEREGMPVIDDPTSILRCTNKVYLAELLRINKVPTPRTRVISRRRLASLEGEIGYPIVLKIPDGSFSRGVFKVENRGQLETVADQLFEESDLILAQEFMYTPFDWRVGVLNGRALFVCQYHMAGKHWQIIKHGSVRDKYGTFKTLAVDETPPEVIGMAVRAAGLIGNGLYGVDLKQTEQGVHVIEVNDNPNIDVGIEDQFLKDDLYLQVMREFLRRLEGRNHSPA